jgi:hypothetical protein
MYAQKWIKIPLYKRPKAIKKFLEKYYIPKQWDGDRDEYGCHLYGTITLLDITVEKMEFSRTDFLTSSLMSGIQMGRSTEQAGLPDCSHNPTGLTARS